jgi:hypothetical protein
MGALELRLHDINERLAASSAEAAALERLLRRREAVLETGDDVRDRLEAAVHQVQRVEARIRSSPALFRFSLHRRRIEGFLDPENRDGFIAAALFMVLQHELASLREELQDLEGRLRVLRGSDHKHRLLVDWRDELIAQLGPGGMGAAEQALERVSAAVTVASRAEDVRIIEEARSTALRARDDLKVARGVLHREARVQKDDVAALADLVPEGTRHFGLREAKRRVEQATLRLGYIHDELRSIEGLSVGLRHPFFAMEAFLQGLFDDFHRGGKLEESIGSLEEAEGYLDLLAQALEGACAQAGLKLDGARSQEAAVVGRAVEALRPSPARIKGRYSVWDAAPLRQ